MDNNFHITDLNAWCLLKIFDYLPFRDKIMFASIDEHIRNIFYVYLRTNPEFYLVLNYDKWSLNDIATTFKLIGPITEEFQIKENNSNIIPRIQTCFDFVLEYCSNLKVLQLSGFPNSKVIAKQLSKNFKLLEKLQISKGLLTDQEVVMLTNLKYIKELDLSENREITGDFIDLFSNLKSLKMEYCLNLDRLALLKLFEKSANVVSLDLEHSTPINDVAVGVIIDNCKILETLKIRILMVKDSINWKRINELKHLRSLSIEESWNYHGVLEEIRFNRNIINYALRSLAPQLTYLKIHFMQIDHDKNFNAERFKAIFTLKNLHELHLIGYLSCYVIYWDDLLEFVKSSELKTLNFTHSNSMLDFAEAHFIEFIEKAHKLKKINLNYPNSFVHMPFLLNFLRKLSNKQCKFIPKFTLEIKVGNRTKNEILNHPDYLACKDLFELIINLSNCDFNSFLGNRFYDAVRNDHGIHHDEHEEDLFGINYVEDNAEVLDDMNDEVPMRVFKVRPQFDVESIINNDKSIRIVLNPSIAEL